jgi:ABC-type glutathione transport system ATPase component
MGVSLLEVRDLVVRYPGASGRGSAGGRGRGRGLGGAAVGGVSLEVAAGRTVGLVGESGSGKSSIAKAVLGLVAPESGSVRFGGRDVVRPSLALRRELARELQVVFQDPFSSLNPTRTVGSSLVEPLLVGRSTRRGEAERAAVETLGRVGLPAEVMERYPSAFSGGQLQRIAIARALVMKPRLIICDEAVSALDLSVQAQVLNLLVDLQVREGLSYLFISHDLAVVRHMSHQVVVLQRGQVVERGTGEQVWTSPQHPYTRSLIASVPETNPTRRDVNADPAKVFPAIGGRELVAVQAQSK